MYLAGGLQSDGNLVFYKVKVNDDIIEFGGEMKFENGVLTIEKLDIQGSSKNKMGRQTIKDLAIDFGRQYGAKEVVIYGNTRTTGAKPGKRPVYRFKIE